MRKDVKKSSYYVWWLGSREARGPRGPEFVANAVRSLVERERESEPYKVTLQVSHKGLKIVQNSTGEAVKRLIPHHAVTFVHQTQDLVACVLAPYDPATAECPVHVHAYRCDSADTASLLSGQLRALLDRPDEPPPPTQPQRQRPRPPQPQQPPAPPGSDGRGTRESESSGGSSSERLSAVGQERANQLYDSLAAELREKLNVNAGPRVRTRAHAPILLPPRDYDTVHRRKGNLSDVTARRCLNTAVVGVNAVTAAATPTPPATTGPTTVTAPGTGTGAVRTKGSSGGSSGIGSDHAPSPDHDPDARFLDNRSSSDEEWNAEPTKDSPFLLQRSWRGGGEASLPRARRSPGEPQSPGRRAPAPAPAPVPAPVPAQPEARILPLEKRPGPGQRRRKNAEERQRSPSPTGADSSMGSLTPRDRFNDAKEKFMSLEREKQEERERLERAAMAERRRNERLIEPPISPSVTPLARTRSTKSWTRSVDSEDEADDDYGHRRGREYTGEVAPPRRERDRERSYYGPDADDYSPKQHGMPSLPYARREINPGASGGYGVPEEKSAPGGQRRYASPRRERSPDVKPRKDRFAIPPTRKNPDEREDASAGYVGRIPRSHLNVNPVPVPFAESDSAIPLERYRSPAGVAGVPGPPRHPRHPSVDSDDYRRPSNDDKKRRSAYESAEDERRRNSNELAKEFKRRSYRDGNEPEPAAGYQELDDRERYPGLDRETARAQEEARPPRYRHSYAEPFHAAQVQAHYRQPAPGQGRPGGRELLHRTNSSLSAGRVGMAAVHPY